MNIVSISNGQGAPSMALLLLAIQDRIKVDVSITADTGWENDLLWSTGERTTSKEYFERITKPLAEKNGIRAFYVRSKKRSGNDYEPLPNFRDLTRTDLPLFGSDMGRLRQTCTSKYKIKAIRQQLRDIGATSAVTMLGLTMSEVHRIKPSDVKWAQHKYPLIDFGIYRNAAIDMMNESGVPYLITTECDGCPHKDKHRWLRTSAKTIDELAEFEARFNGEFFLTPHRNPLKLVIEMMKNDNDNQMSLFDSDSCDSGYCFV